MQSAFVVGFDDKWLMQRVGYNSFLQFIKPDRVAGLDPNLTLQIVPKVIVFAGNRILIGGHECISTIIAQHSIHIFKFIATPNTHVIHQSHLVKGLSHLRLHLTQYQL